MTVTKKPISTPSAEQLPNTAQEVINFLTANTSPTQLRAGLSELLISWLKSEENMLLKDEHKQEVYYCFYVLSTALKMMERAGL